MQLPLLPGSICPAVSANSGRGIVGQPNYADDHRGPVPAGFVIKTVWYGLPGCDASVYHGAPWKPLIHPSLDCPGEACCT
jgi:hypothetical protein